jgi:hypothetical protein
LTGLPTPLSPPNIPGKCNHTEIPRKFHKLKLK